MDKKSLTGILLRQCNILCSTQHHS